MASSPEKPSLDALTIKPVEQLTDDEGARRVTRHAVQLGDDPPFVVYEAPNATILGQIPIFGLYEGTRFTGLSESVNYDARAPYALNLAMVSLERLEGPLAMQRIAEPCCLLHNEWSRNIWHWLTEYLPKAVALEAFGFTGTYIIPPDLPYARASLELLGLPGARIAEYHADGMIADQLTFTQMLPGRALAERPALAHRVRAAMLGRFDAPPPARRLYLARHGVRQIVNEAELMAVLEPHGFTRVYLDDHSFEEQLWLVSNAEIVLGPHGAAMVFALFMPPNGLVVELFSPLYISPAMIELCGLMGHTYHMVPSRWGPPEPWQYADNVVALVEAVALILQRWTDKGTSAQPDARGAAYRAALGA